MTTNTSRSLDPSSVAMRLGLAAAAIAGTAATTTDADASIVAYTPATPISVPNNIDGVYINFLNGVTGTSAAAVPGWDFDPYGVTAGLLFYWGAAVSAGVASTTTGPYLDLAVGSVVSSASTFSQNANGAANETSAFRTSGTHVLGFRFQNETTSTVNYGYLRMATTGATGFPASILGWSYENTGAAITVAAPVPEPESALLFSMGALALGASHLRRLRRKAH